MAVIIPFAHRWELSLKSCAVRQAVQRREVGWGLTTPTPLLLGTFRWRMRLAPYLCPLPIVFVLAGESCLLEAFQDLTDAPGRVGQHWL